MATFTFADRYAEEGLSPSSEQINSRQEPAKRIVANINNDQILDLVAVYYGSTDVNLDWFRDEFLQEDASFSLVNNAREARVLAALILGELIDDNNSVAILAVSIGGVKGARVPSQAHWLVVNAEEALRKLSVTDRALVEISTKVTPTATQQLDEEIKALVANDWPTLLTVLGKIRLEAQKSVKATATQVMKAMDLLDDQAKLMREESQMLWWLIGGHSRTFERSFSTFEAQQAALVGAVDLGALTTASDFGPIAIPAMLAQVIASAQKPKGQPSLDLATAIDGFTLDDLKRLEVPANLPARLAPIATAIGLARTIGIGAWHLQFQTKAGLDTSIQLGHVSLADQLYRECLLGKLLW
ncbi:GTPase-associated system all-helical protein GASH [Aeromonas veronii]|uniref:GTPase-associated system all-helical protein GASH n=1 Tax=Aeromonas veronii TaxID=654 RepID=UPI001D0A6C1D|nr:GTPase-associated system all-helical protein GASH [Aeromonas veronii]MCC0090616.1 hypothetical protein [Aeromonas veronii]UZE61066.1 GTPase-associated system all-helical protein GASH [Aeromonas veronii]